jgi:hypothetical protein
MHNIVKFQKNIHLDDSVVVVGQLADLPVHMLDQFGIGVEMHTLDVDGHVWTFRFREKNESYPHPVASPGALCSIYAKKKRKTNDPGHNYL